ncbi:hypothetical protein LTR84_005681 [Exophiala bonariae]|uniref:Clr5 domain-containing protein n=1 Tax=Exophiala bonariae TaxID=1690606 RepID=A0AAV9N738_9EURO|nr:hypothetical protein LTR84_005681 [Exophiala bonariae]
MRPFRNLISKDVEPGKRHHPHTRVEWESFRDDFTRLYQIDRRTLADVVELLSEKGFRASEKQCKTYIKKWGLEKNNSQVDMIFAAQNQLRRNGKKTIYKYRGRRRTEADVAHYWSRKKANFEDFSPIPTTPAGMEYFTPASSPSDTMEGTGSGHIALTPDDPEINSSDDAMPVTVESDVFREYERLPQVRSQSPSAVAAIFLDAACRRIISNYQSKTLGLIELPDTFQQRAHVLNHSQEYFSWWLQEVDLSEEKFQSESKVAWDFRESVYALQYAICYDHSKDSIEIMFFDVIQMLPTLWQQESPSGVLCTMDMLFSVSDNSAEERSYTQLIAYYAFDHALKLWGNEHPCTKFLRTIIDPGTSPFDMICALLLGKEVFRGVFDRNHWLQLTLLHRLDRGATKVKQFDQLEIENEIYQLYLATYQAEITDRALYNLLISQGNLVSAYAERGNYHDARILLEDGLERLRGIDDPEKRSHVRAIFRRRWGNLNYEQGRIRQSLNAFIESLSIFLQLYGPRHSETMESADWCHWLQDKLDTETQQRLQAGFTVP